MNSKKISMIPNEITEAPIEKTICNKRLKYIVVRTLGEWYTSNSVTDKFEKEVNVKLQEGWNLYGGVAIGGIGEGYFYICQAMIKEEEDNEEES